MPVARFTTNAHNQETIREIIVFCFSERFAYQNNNSSMNILYANNVHLEALVFSSCQIYAQRLIPRTRIQVSMET